MQKFAQGLIDISGGWAALAFSLVFVLFMVFVLPDQAAKAEEYAQGAGSPDTSFFYSAEQLYEFADAYGPEGRQAYVRARFSFDLLFPLVYGGFLLTVSGWLLGRVFPAGSRGRLLVLVPLLGVLFDFLENGAAAYVIGTYPTRHALVAALAPWFTLLKWLFVYAGFGVLLLAGGLWIWRWFRDRPKT